MKWQYRILFILLLTLLIVVYFVFKKQPQTRSWPTDGIVLSVFQPVSQWYHSSADYLNEKIDDYAFLKDTRAIDRGLKKEIEQLKLQNQALRIQAGVAESSQSVEDAFAFLNKKVLPANILGYSLFTESKTLWIDRGERDGVAINDVVIEKNGLVGRVFQVYHSSSKVLLLIDSYFAVDAMNHTTQIRSLVRGLNTDRLISSRYPFLTQLEYIRSAQEMKVGDQLVTSGLGGIYPYGIPVGSVLTVQSSDENLFEKSLVIPAVDFAKLNRVYVLTSQSDEKPHVLPQLTPLDSSASGATSGSDKKEIKKSKQRNKGR